jgi:hypothetical protein
MSWPATGSGRRAFARLLRAACLAAALGVCAAPRAGRAHEHWIEARPPRPAAGETVAVHIGSGHAFASSAFALGDKVIHGVALQTPGGESVTVATAVDGDGRTGTVTVASAGVHVLCLTLKRRRAAAPGYEARTILPAGDGGDDPARYAQGRGLEIVPGAALSALVPGGELPLRLYMDGVAVEGTLEVYPEGRKARFLRTAPDRPARLRLSRPGRYLAVAHVRGRGCSLVFSVGEAQREAP